MQVTTIGLDLAKHWFQVHGVDARHDCRPQEAATQRSSEFLSILAAVSGRHGGLCDSALLGA